MVQLVKLELEGFGKFDKEKVVEFSKGINFITGLNEAGKSTILEGILASIFKYTKGQVEPFFSWKNNTTCKTILTYKTDKEETYRITTDYKNGRRKLELVDKTRIKEIASADKNIDPILKEHFGFDERKVFENTAFIRQSQMMIQGDAPVKNKLKDMIEEVFAGRSEASATKALKVMKKAAKDAKNELEILEGEESELSDKLTSAKETQASVSKDGGDAANISKEYDEKKAKLEKLKKNKDLFDKKEKLLEQQKEVDDQLKNVDEMIEALSEEQPEKIASSPNKVGAIILIIVGALLSITGEGAIIGIPMILGGIYLLTKKPQKEQATSKDNSSKKAKFLQYKKEILTKKGVLETKLEDFKLVKFTLDDFEEIEELEEKVEDLKEKKVALQSKVKTTMELVESPEEIAEKLNVLQEQQTNLERRREEHELAAKYLEMAESQVHQKFTPAIEKNAKPLLTEITNKRYSDLKIQEDTLDIHVRTPETKEFVEISVLSQGVRDQLYFAIRSVMSDLLSSQTNIPLILDDPFHNFDEPRLSKTIETLKTLSNNKQVVLISHRPYHQEFKNLSSNVVELK